MLIEFIGGKMDGEIKNVKDAWCYVDGVIKLLDKAPIFMPESETKVNQKYEFLIYRRKPDTNKFYFDKVEEV